MIRPEFFRKNVVVCQRNERKTENGRRRQNFGEILVKTLKNRNTGLFEPIGGCGPTNMTNGGGMNMVVSKNYKIKEQNGMYYRNLLGGLYRENPVKSRNYEAVKSSKKWENVGNSYIIPALLLYRYSYI